MIEPKPVSASLEGDSNDNGGFDPMGERQDHRFRLSFKALLDFGFRDSFPRLVGRVWNAFITREGRTRVVCRWRRWRLHRWTGFGSGHAAIYRLRNGSRFVAHSGDRLSEFIAISGSWEPLESRIVERIQKSGDLTIDIGANVGYFSALFSRCVGPQGKVLAFEPGETTFSKLQTTIDLLGLKNIEAHAMAVADQTRREYFTMSTAGFDALQSLVDRGWMLGGKVVAEVQAVALDDFLSRTLQPGTSPALVKCDVEGGEMRVLAGSSKLLSSLSPPISCYSRLAAMQWKLARMARGSYLICCGDIGFILRPSSRTGRSWRHFKIRINCVMPMSWHFLPTESSLTASLRRRNCYRTAV
jgi:FkbM family methyltransferase